MQTYVYHLDNIIVNNFVCSESIIAQTAVYYI